MKKNLIKAIMMLFMLTAHGYAIAQQHSPEEEPPSYDNPSAPKIDIDDGIVMESPDKTIKPGKAMQKPPEPGTPSVTNPDAPIL